MQVIDLDPQSQNLISKIEDLAFGVKVDHDLLTDILSSNNPHVLEVLRKKAHRALSEIRGTEVYYRGLLEFSNICARNCLYCGIRKDNAKVERYRLTNDEIISTSLWCADNGYGSITLQSGEVLNKAMLSDLVYCVRHIRQNSIRPHLPQGLGITLSIGEIDQESLAQLKEAGAHRYLLRIETTNKELYARLHPDTPNYSERLSFLRSLRQTGWQTGSGVMIGLPGQTYEDLARDLHFFIDEGLHMIGMGPFQPHQDTPLSKESCVGEFSIWPKKTRFEVALKMIGLARIQIPKANIAAATALQALHPFGRERGLDFGANILMPLVTPGSFRAQYSLYDDKPCADEETDECKACLEGRVKHTKREIGYNNWGDSLLAPPFQGHNSHGTHE